MNIRDDISLRATLLFFGVVGIGLLIMGKATYEQQGRGNRWRQLYTKLSIKKNIPIDAIRGTIYTEDGAVLSASVPQFDKWVDLGVPALQNISDKEAKQIDSFFMDLATIVNRNKSWADYKEDFYKARQAHLKEVEAALKANVAKPKFKHQFYKIVDTISFEQNALCKKSHFACLGKNKTGLFDKRFLNE